MHTPFFIQLLTIKGAEREDIEHFNNTNMQPSWTWTISHGSIWQSPNKPGCFTQDTEWKLMYNRKVYGDPYKDGDLIWLYTPAVPRGESKKLAIPSLGGVIQGTTWKNLWLGLQNWRSLQQEATISGTFQSFEAMSSTNKTTATNSWPGLWRREW